MTKLSHLLIVAFAGLAAACSPPPRASAEAATRACLHQIELGFWQGFEGTLAKNGVAMDDEQRATGKAGFDEAMAGAEAKAEVAKCVEGYTRLATPEQAECIAAASTSEAAQRCIMP